MSVKAQAIIPAAGIGERLGLNKPKPLVEIKDKPIFLHTLAVFEKSTLVDSIVLVVHPEHQDVYENLVAKSELTKKIHIVPGGEKRTDSVLNGLNATDEDTEIVIIHDSARPFITVDLIDQSIAICADEDAVIVAVPSKSTIKRINQEDMSVECTLDRSKLWEVQTPQVFKKSILREAYEKVDTTQATDDASLVEQLGIKISVLTGDYANIKITTQDDIELAKMLFERSV